VAPTLPSRTNGSRCRTQSIRAMAIRSRAINKHMRVLKRMPILVFRCNLLTTLGISQLPSMGSREAPMNQTQCSDSPTCQHLLEISPNRIRIPHPMGLISVDLVRVWILSLATIFDPDPHCLRRLCSTCDHSLNYHCFHAPVGTRSQHTSFGRTGSANESHPDHGPSSCSPPFPFLCFVRFVAHALPRCKCYHYLASIWSMTWKATINRRWCDAGRRLSL
jgi:hypothetical protein